MSSKKWKSFFTEAGLPVEAADNYAILFGFEHRISFDMLPDLNREILADMGIKKMGDVISILRYAKKVSMDSQKQKIFCDDDDDEAANMPDSQAKRDFFKADSTNANGNTKRTIINKPVPVNRVVVSKPNLPAKRNVTGLDYDVIASLKRKRVEPPGANTSLYNPNKITKVDMVKKVTPGNKVVFEPLHKVTRVNDFSKQSTSQTNVRAPDSTTPKKTIHARLGLQATNANNSKKSIQGKLYFVIIN